FLRTQQFAEDAGPMAHPVRPDSYMEISNFYTLTIYEKGAEVVRMIRELVGPENFRKGSDLYFERHDGQAVTTEDFVRAMEDASGVDLKQFRLWYSQAGTPQVQVTGHYDASASTYELLVRQSCPPTPDQPTKGPFHIPLRMGLLASDGQALPLHLEGEAQAGDVFERVLDVTRPVQSFVFTGITEQPVPSLLRGFSAPVKLSFDYSREQLLFIMTRDSDGFNRWNAAQELAVGVIQEQLAARQNGAAELSVYPGLVSAYGELLESAIVDASGKGELDQAMLAQLLTLPSEAYLGELAAEIDVDGIHAVREFVANTLAAAHEEAFAKLYSLCQSNEPYKADAAGIAR